jgi:addiction module HigA family antidote
MRPGELLREDVLPALGKSKVEIARLLGVSHQALDDILSEKRPITPAMALRIGSSAATVPNCGSTCSARSILTRPNRNWRQRSRRFRR